LVLADEKFPSRTLPRKLVQQQRRGLEILWVTRDSGSFDKLIPTRLAYPDAIIVTVDDDAMYARWLVSRLTAYFRRHPDTRGPGVPQWGGRRSLSAASPADRTAAVCSSDRALRTVANAEFDDGVHLG
jgi:hypothetical protein